MLSLGMRKVIVISLIGVILLLGNILLLVDWLQEQGVIEWAKDFRKEYLTGTALTIIVVLMILLVRQGAAKVGPFRHCPVCEHTILGNKKYCSDCGSSL